MVILRAQILKHSHWVITQETNLETPLPSSTNPPCYKFVSKCSQGGNIIASKGKAASDYKRRSPLAHRPRTLKSWRSPSGALLASPRRLRHKVRRAEPEDSQMQDLLAKLPRPLAKNSCEALATKQNDRRRYGNLCTCPRLCRQLSKLLLRTIF